MILRLFGCDDPWSEQGQKLRDQRTPSQSTEAFTDGGKDIYKGEQNTKEIKG